MTSPTASSPATAQTVLDTALLAALETTIPRYIQTIRRALEEVEGEIPLTPPQFRCLQAVAARGVTLTTHLARQMQVTVPTMTSRLDGLVERGLVQRQPDPLSRRQVQVSLTPAGEALLGRYQAIIDARLLTLLGPLPVASRRRLLVAMQDLATVLAPPGSGECSGERRCDKSDS